MNNKENSTAKQEQPSASKPQRSVWGGVVDFFSIVLIINAGWCIHHFVNYEWYWNIFQYLPPQMILYRYIISFSARILQVIFALGVICRKEFFRKATFFLMTGTMFILYWKHPWEAVIYGAKSMNLTISDLERVLWYMGINIDVKLVTLGTLYLADILVCLPLAILLVLPPVRKLFQAPAQTTNKSTK